MESKPVIETRVETSAPEDTIRPVSGPDVQPAIKNGQCNSSTNPSTVYLVRQSTRQSTPPDFDR